MDSGKKLWEKQKADRKREETYKGLHNRDYALAARGASRDSFHHYLKRCEENAGKAATPSPPIDLVEQRAQLEARIRAIESKGLIKTLLDALNEVDITAEDAASRLDFISNMIPSPR